MNLITIIRAFLLSIKGSWVIRTAVLSPIVLICLRLLLILFDHDSNFPHHAWDNFFNGNYSFWYGLFFPIIISMICFLLMEHDRPVRAYIFSLPLDRGNYLLSKMMIAFAVITLSSVVLILMSIIAGQALTIMKPSAGFTFSIPNWISYLSIAGLSGLVSIIQISLSMLVMEWTSSFVMALGIGLTGSLINLVGIHNGIVQKFWIWAYPLDVLGASNHFTIDYQGWPIYLMLLVTFGGSAFLSWLGGRHLERSDI